MINRNWKSVRFKEVVELKQGLAFNSKNNHLMVEEGIPLLRIVDLNNNSETKFVDSNLVPKRYISKPTDIIYSRTGVHLGLVFTNRIGVVHNNCFRIIPKKGIDHMYLYWYLRQPTIINHARGVAGGAAQPDLNHDAFKSIFFSYPDLSTQKKIASILSAYDDLIEINNQRIKLLEEMAEEIYKEWFVRLRFPGYQHAKFFDQEGKEVEHGTVGALPVGWERGVLKNICLFQMGQSPKSEFYNEEQKGLPFHQGVTNFGSRYPLHKTFCTDLKRIAIKGDILLSVRAPVGRINISDTKLIIGRGLCSIKHVNDCQNYLFYLLKDIFKVEDSFGNGAVFNAVSKSDLERITINQPDITVVQKFQSLVKPLDDEINVLTEKNQILQETRDLLLPRLISGKLNVEDLEMSKAENLPMAAEPVAEYNS